MVSIKTYNDLIKALRSRTAEVNTTFCGIDAVAGLPSNYTAKLLAAQPIKKMSVFTMLCIADALGLRLLLAPDPDALARLRERSDWTVLRRRGPQFRANRHKRRASK
jgi:hypothetical protein